MVAAVGGRPDLRLRPHQGPRAEVYSIDTPPPTVIGHPARRARLLLHPHRPHRPLPADARQGGVLPDGLGRQRPAHRAPGAELLRRALRPLAPLRRRLHPAGEARPEAAGADRPAELHRALRAAGRARTSRSSRALLRTGSGSRWTGRSTTRPSARGTARQPARLPAQPRPRRGLPAGGAHPVGRHLPDGGRPGRARGARVRRPLLPRGVPRRPTATRPHRDHPARADPRRGRPDRPPRRRALPAAVRHDGHLARSSAWRSRCWPIRSPRWTRAPASRCAAPSATSPTSRGGASCSCRSAP